MPHYQILLFIGLGAMVNFSTKAEIPTDEKCVASTSNTTILPCDPEIGLPHRIPIYIGGMFPLETNKLFSRVNGTVLAAVDHINGLDGILDGYEIRMRWNWTQGEPRRALRLLHDFVYVNPPVLMAWGPMFSSVAVIVNEVAAKYNIIQVTLGSSPTLLNRTRFPLTLSCGTFEDDLNQPRLALMKEMGWTKASIVFEDIELFRSNSEHLQKTLEEGDITILTVEAVKDKDQHRSQINNLKNHDARIIFAHFYEKPASKFFCEAYRMRFFGPHIIWILNGWINDGWWRHTKYSTCTSQELEQVLRFHIAFHGFYKEADVDMINFGGTKPRPEVKAYVEKLITSKDYSARDLLSQSYDSMFVLALALNASIRELAQLDPPRRLEDFRYSDTEMVDVFMRSVRNVRFYGATSRLSLDETATRTRESLQVVVKQFQNTEDEPMKRVLLTEVRNSWIHFTRIGNNNFVWHGDSQPVDGKSYREQVILVSRSLRTVVLATNTVGVAIAVCFIYINVRYQNRRAIKISSPKINNLTALGGLLLYCFVFVNSVDSLKISDNGVIIVCHVSRFLLCVGFSLAFGTLFMKTFRIHCIFTKAVTQLKNVELPDRILIAWACVPVAADIGILIVHLTLDDVIVKREQMDAVEDTSQPGKEVFTIPVRQFCWGQHDIYFMTALYVTKGVLLVFGIFLSWETRQIAVAELNDSKYLAMSVYVVTLAVAITIPVSALHGDDVNVTYGIVSGAVILATTTVLCLVFLPKVILHWRTRGRDWSITIMKERNFSSGTVRSFGKTDSRTIRLTNTLQEKLRELETLKQEWRSVMQEKSVNNPENMTTASALDTGSS